MSLDRHIDDHRRKVVLFGISGRPNGFLLSLYDLKSFIVNGPLGSDFDIALIQEPFFSDTSDELRLSDCAERICADHPWAVGFSCYIWNIVAQKRLASLVRQRLPDCHIIAGGPEITPDYISSGYYDQSAFDVLIFGEGEQTLVEVLSLLASQATTNNPIPGAAIRISTDAKPAFQIGERRSPMPSLGLLPSPFLTGIVDDATLSRAECEANIETQRGCNLRCAYCVYHKDMDRISYNSADRALGEIDYLVRRGIRNIRIVDANFSSSLEHAKAIMAGLVSRRYELKLTCELIPGFLDAELARLFGDFIHLHQFNDVRLGIGIQSIHAESLKRMRRNIRPDTFIKTLSLIRQNDVFAKVDIIVGLPGETADDISETLEFMMAALWQSDRHLLCCHIMRGLPGTELLPIAVAFGMEFSSPYSDEAFGLSHDAHELYQSPSLPRDAFIDVLRQTAVVFWLMNSIRWIDRVGRHGFRRHEILTKVDEAAKLFAGHRMPVVAALVVSLLGRPEMSTSRFCQPDFPRPESWWWESATHEIREDWVLAALDEMLTDRTTTSPHSTGVG